MQAGLIAVPLPLPHRGSSHERVSAVLADTSPSVALTTSAVAGDIDEYVDQARLDAVPKIVEIDSLKLDFDGGTRVQTADLPSIAYLQYSSGSTRLPTGVTVSHRTSKTAASRAHRPW
jgi:fatty acid CoA ligase FadD21